MKLNIVNTQNAGVLLLFKTNTAHAAKNYGCVKRHYILENI